MLAGSSPAASQALMDAVQLAEMLEDSIRSHGPITGLDVALPAFERKMLRWAGYALQPPEQMNKKLIRRNNRFKHYVL